MKIYAFSGLGADQRVFQYLSVDNEIVPIEWVEPDRNETIEAYAMRLSQVIYQEEDFGLLGVSFGGLIAVEISKRLNPKLTILISSVETRQDLRLIYRWIGKTNILKIIPKQLFKPPSRIAQWIFGAKERQLIREILIDTDLKFAKWAMIEFLNWKNDKHLANPKLKIGGTHDKLIPGKAEKGEILIQGGQHFMIVDRADEISQIINYELATKL